MDGVILLLIGLVGVIAAVEVVRTWPRSVRRSLQILLVTGAVIASALILRRPGPDAAAQSEPSVPTITPTTTPAGITLPAEKRAVLKRAPRDQKQVAASLAKIFGNEVDVSTYSRGDFSCATGNFAEARETFENLRDRNAGELTVQQRELLRFRIYLTLLLEGYFHAAAKMQKEFEFTGDTPALYYANAAVEFRSGNFKKAGAWIDSAEMIYGSDLNSVFVDPFFDIGWLAP